MRALWKLGNQFYPYGFGVDKQEFEDGEVDDAMKNGWHLTPHDAQSASEKAPAAEERQTLAIKGKRKA